MTKRFLPRIPGYLRNKAYTSLEDEIEDELRNIAKIYNCSKSFVQNTIIAEALNIKVKAKYYDYKRIVTRTKKSA